MVGRFSRAVGTVALAGLVGCGSQSAEAPSAGTATAPIASTNSDSVLPLALPDHVDDLATAIPGDASLVVLVPPLEPFGLPKAQLEQAISLLSGQFAKNVGIPENVLKSALTSFDGAAFFNLSDF